MPESQDPKGLPGSKLSAWAKRFVGKPYTPPAPEDGPEQTDIDAHRPAMTAREIYREVWGEELTPAQENFTWPAGQNQESPPNSPEPRIESAAEFENWSQDQAAADLEDQSPPNAPEQRVSESDFCEYGCMPMDHGNDDAPKTKFAFDETTRTYRPIPPPIPPARPEDEVAFSFKDRPRPDMTELQAWLTSYQAMWEACRRKGVTPLATINIATAYADSFADEDTPADIWLKGWQARD